MLTKAYLNNPGMAQVGVIYKAQKYSRNNYCEIFQLSHSAEKYPKKFSPKLKKSFFLNWKHQKKSTCLWKKKFWKNVFDKKSRILPKSQKIPLGS